MKKLLALLSSLIFAVSLQAYSAGDPGFVYSVESVNGYEYLSENATSTVGDHIGYSIQVIVIVPPQSMGTQDITASIIDSYGGQLYEVDSGYMEDGSKVYLMQTDAFHYYGTLQVITWDNTSHSSGRWKKLYIR